ncbi:MAG: carbohydrate ABC transporter permease [Albidovulum sp.]|nr:carbohydrate ABC transporter permease [Albidovulum sp.]
MKDSGMIENDRSVDRAATIVLVAGMSFILIPLAIAAVTATQPYETFIEAGGLSFALGGHFLDNMEKILSETKLLRQLGNSLAVATIVAVMKVGFCFLAAYALVFFEGKFRRALFAVMIATVMLPLDLRVITTYQIVANVAMPLNWILDATGANWAIEKVAGFRPYFRLSLLDTYFGTAAPIAANCTAVFIFRQFFLTLPKDLPRAAIMDGAGPIRFMIDIVLPLSKTPIVATLLFFFVGAWTNYLWPLVAASTPDQQTAVVGLARIADSDIDEIPQVPLLMAGALFVSFIPVALIAVMQRQIVRGLNLSSR